MSGEQSLFQFLRYPVSTIGWTCGCWDGYPDRWYKRLWIVRWLTRFDPVEFP